MIHVGVSRVPLAPPSPNPIFSLPLVSVPSTTPLRAQTGHANKEAQTVAAADTPALCTPPSHSHATRWHAPLPLVRAPSQLVRPLPPLSSRFPLTTPFPHVHRTGDQNGGHLCPVLPLIPRPRFRARAIRAPPHFARGGA
jgi:hypothetical protein